MLHGRSMPIPLPSIPYSITGTVENNLRFPGQYYDVETGEYYNWFRYYNSETGRYLSFDPILHPANGLSKCSKSKNMNILSFESLLENPQHFNPYSYTGNDPINKIDATGLVWYGNWCGPGGSGTPRNCTDKACKRHDECYEKCGLDAANRWLPGNILGGCAAACDKQLAKDWKNCACSNASGSW